MKWETKVERSRSFAGKRGWLVATLTVAAVQLSVAVLLWAAGLIPAAVTMMIIVFVCCPLVLWKVWRD